MARSETWYRTRSSESTAARFLASSPNAFAAEFIEYMPREYCRVDLHEPYNRAAALPVLLHPSKEVLAAPPAARRKNAATFCRHGLTETRSCCPRDATTI